MEIAFRTWWVNIGWNTPTIWKVVDGFDIYFFFPHGFWELQSDKPYGPSGLYKIQKLFFGARTRANILGSGIVNLLGFDPGFWFCRARNLVQQENVDWKIWKQWGSRLGFCRECRVWSDPCLWFCRGPPPPLFNFVSTNCQPPTRPP